MRGATGHHAGDGESTGMKFPGGACLAEVKTKEAFSPGGGVGGPKATSWGSPLGPSHNAWAIFKAQGALETLSLQK